MQNEKYKNKNGSNIPAARTSDRYMDRRGFLIGAGASVLGLGSIRRDAKPTWLEAGLKKIAESGRPGLVVVVPADNKELIRLSDALKARLKEPSGAVAEVLADAVWICLREKDARARFEKVSRLMRIDAAGRCVAGADVELKEFETEEGLAAAARRLLDADLEGRAKRAWEAAGDALRAELDALADDDPARRDAAHKAIAARLPGVTPILVRESRTAADPERAARCRAILRESLGKPLALPFGADWGYATCGDPRYEGEVSIACGLARADMEACKVIRFLALAAKK
jgi:hypothetical protein